MAKWIWENHKNINYHWHHNKGTYYKKDLKKKKRKKNKEGLITIDTELHDLIEESLPGFSMMKSVYTSPHVRSGK